MVLLQYRLSVVEFALFILLVLGRAVMLRRRGVRAVVFGSTDKTDFILAPFMLALVYVVFANAFGWPVWGVLTRRFWVSTVAGWVGLSVGVVALVFFIYTLASFGRSFRVGIDVNDPGKLVTSGAFALSRNPIYVCFFLGFCGLFLVHCNLVIAVVLAGFALVIHRQVLREEKFLASHYGAAFEEYRKQVRRYL